MELSLRAIFFDCKREKRRIKQIEISIWIILKYVLLMDLVDVHCQTLFKSSMYKSTLFRPPMTLCSIYCIIWQSFVICISACCYFQRAHLTWKYAIIINTSKQSKNIYLFDCLSSIHSVIRSLSSQLNRICNWIFSLLQWLPIQITSCKHEWQACHLNIHTHHSKALGHSRLMCLSKRN